MRSESKIRALTITEFCKAYNISRSMLYKLIKKGHAPQLMHVGRKRLISSDAAETWQRKMEKLTAAK